MKMKKDLLKISKIIIEQSESVFEKKMTAKKCRESLAKIEGYFEEKRLVYEMLPSGKVGFFFTYECAAMYEYREYFFRIPNCYCVSDPKIRKKFYDLIRKASLEFKEVTKVKRMVIDVFAEDHLSKDYFLAKGQLTYVELVGKTKFSLEYLEKDKNTAANISIVKMNAGDLPKLVNLDLASHLTDKTSRMRVIFMRPDAKIGMQNFYKHMLKRKSCFVAKEGKKIAGSICYFIDEKNKYGLIASIFVANQFKGLGISKVLYRRVLNEFSKQDLKYYIGASTTHRVLSLSSKMGRKEFLSSIIVKI